VQTDHFHLYRRARHILRESERVERFCELSQTPSSSTEELGQLLVESHNSCQGDYDCTHEQTDLLQSICMRLGAIGSRQTGGGWGGAVISLVHIEQAAEFLAALKAEYAPYQKLDAAELGNNAFITRPGVGAGGE
jgi:galactokinase